MKSILIGVALLFSSAGAYAAPETGQTEPDQSLECASAEADQGVAPQIENVEYAMIHTAVGGPLATLEVVDRGKVEADGTIAGTNCFIESASQVGNTCASPPSTASPAIYLIEHDVDKTVMVNAIEDTSPGVKRLDL